MRNKNHMAVVLLHNLGFPMPKIRKAMHKLTGISQPDIAKQLRVSRPAVTTTIDGSRKAIEIQRGIAAIWDIPVDVLFGDGRCECDHNEKSTHICAA